MRRWFKKQPSDEWIWKPLGVNINGNSYTDSVRVFQEGHYFGVRIYACYYSIGVTLLSPIDLHPYENFNNLRTDDELTVKNWCIV